MEHHQLPNFAINQLCKLFALIVKLDWLEQDTVTLEKPFQNSIKQLINTAKVLNKIYFYKKF